MSTGLLFVTAPSADFKLINRILLYLHDWEYESGDRFHLVTSRSASFLQGKFAAHLSARRYEDGGQWQDLVATSAPVAEDLVNEWSGASVADVEAFCLELDRKQESAGSHNKKWAHRFVVLDEEGLQAAGGGKDGDGEDEGGQRTCVLAEREIDWDAEPLTYPERFNKVRLPWYQTYLTWCNLDISNVGWDELMAEEGQRDGWWVFDVRDSGEYISEKKKIRDGEIEQLVDERRA